MAVKIRLRRMGAKKSPSTESSSPMRGLRAMVASSKRSATMTPSPTHSPSPWTRRRRRSGCRRALSRPRRSRASCTSSGSSSVPGRSDVPAKEGKKGAEKSAAAPAAASAPAVAEAAPTAEAEAAVEAAALPAEEAPAADAVEPRAGQGVARRSIKRSFSQLRSAPQSRRGDPDEGAHRVHRPFFGRPPGEREGHPGRRRAIDHLRASGGPGRTWARSSAKRAGSPTRFAPC